MFTRHSPKPSFEWFPTRVSPDIAVSTPPDRTGSDRTGPDGRHRSRDHAVIDSLQLGDVAALDELLQAVAQLGFVVSAPPPWHVHGVQLRVLRPDDERRHSKLGKSPRETSQNSVR